MKNISGTVKEIIIAAHLDLYSKPLKQIHSNGKVKKTKVKGLISNCKIHITSKVLCLFLIIWSTTPTEIKRFSGGLS
jgi:hypothetical protein